MIDQEHDFALALHCYYAGELLAGRKACERLLRQQMPPERERVVRRNRTWYTPVLDELVETRMVRVEIEPLHEGWTLFNPSVVFQGGQFLCNVRSSNYRIVDGRYIIPPEDGNRIRTENALTRWTTGLHHLGETWVRTRYETTDYPVDGLEDVRLNVIDYRVFASATVRNLKPLDGTCRIATAEVLEHSSQTINIQCPATPEGRHEKNWMPITGRREWLYSCSDGGRVATVCREGDGWRINRHAAAPHIARSFRGGSQLINAGDGQWLALIHEVATENDGRRIYEHRFVQFDEAAGWAIVAVSPVFAFREKRAIEFAAGLAVFGDQLVASFGVRDAEAWLASMSLFEVMQMMERA